MFGVSALPRKKKTIKILRRNRVKLGAQPINCAPMNPGEQPAIAPFLFFRRRIELPAEKESFGFKGKQCRIDLRTDKAQPFREFTDRYRSAGFHSPTNQF